MKYPTTKTTDNRSREQTIEPTIARGKSSIDESCVGYTQRETYAA